MLSVDDRRGGETPPARFNLAEHVLWVDGADPDKIALSVLSPAGADEWSYRRLRDRVLRTGAALLEAGLRPGDRLLLRLGNTTDFPLAFLGAVSAGILPVPTSAALTEGEIQRIADILEPAAVLGAGGIALPRGVRAVAVGDLDAVTPLDAPVETGADEPVFIVFTSGTSDRPLGVLHAHRAVWARRMMVAGWYGLTSTDRVLHAGAFNWTFTLGTGLLDPWALGATALIPAPDAGAEALPRLLERHAASILAGAPGVFRRLLRLGGLNLPTLRHGLSAGETLSPDLRRRWQEETGTDLHEAFGQSECSTFISGSPSRPAPDGAIGYAQPGRRIAVLCETGPVARGEIGEIAIDRADPGLMLGYLGDRAARFDGTWFRTGDLGVMREDGAVAYAGRRDDVLTSGGFRVSPVEVEAAMMTCAGVEDAAAVDHRLAPDTNVIALHYAADLA
ncbi:MAG: AMP-binding protein, partial [Silicimonas sp.]|nr:AMP-binding protein [Silicimonas sp.]